MKIYTHVNVDLDAACSVWAAKKFIPGAENASIEFRPANWDGSGMGEDDIALDIEAGGRGLKGEKGEDGVIHSCFALIVAKYAPSSDREALDSIIKFIDAQDSRGSAVKFFIPEAEPKVQEIIGSTSLNTVLRALQATLHSDALVIERMSEILSGILELMRAKKRAEEEAARAEILPGGRVAVIVDPKETGVNGLLFDRGVKIIVYQDGNNIGIVRAEGVDLRMDHPEVRAVIEKAGEANEWFAHPAGFLYCRGSRKAPAQSPSKVDPLVLARTVDKLL